MQRTITCRTPTYADLGQLHSDIINYFQNEGTWEIYPKISKGGLTFWVVFIYIYTYIYIHIYTYIVAYLVCRRFCNRCVDVSVICVSPFWRVAVLTSHRSTLTLSTWVYSTPPLGWCWPSPWLDSTMASQTILTGAGP